MFRKSRILGASILVFAFSLIMVGCGSGANITAQDAVSSISAAIGKNVDQEDPFWGLLFPSVLHKAEIWSAPYVVVFVYPDSSALQAGLEGFKNDLNNWTGTQYYRYCNNILVEYDARYEQEIKGALSNWCTFRD